MTIWFDAGETLDHFDTNVHPTGVQRAALEIMRAAHDEFADRVAYCRFVKSNGTFEAIDFDRIAAAASDAALGDDPASLWRDLLRSGRRLIKTRARDSVLGRRASRAFAMRLARGDTVVCLGLPWKTPDYGARIGAIKRTHAVRFALLIHDIFPYTHPEICHRAYLDMYPRWFEAVFPQCDEIFVSSEYCREAVRDLCLKRGWPLAPLAQIPFGIGLPVSGPRAGPGGAGWPARFVLYVSSLESRKNHSRLLRVWYRLIERHGRDAVPSLIFLGAGRLDPELRRAAEPLGGKLAVIRRATDAVLRDAYRNCLFTVFPSLLEGWGLPVAESLAFGKFCVTSNGGSLPEAGRELVDYFAPVDEADMLAKVERALFEPGYLAARTARIEREYRPPTWRDGASRLLGVLEGSG